MGVGLMVVGLALTLVYFVVVGFIALICLIIFWPLGIIVGVCWLAATAWLLMWSLRSDDGKRSNRFVNNRQKKNVALEKLKRRAPRVANEAASMIQTSKWDFDETVAAMKELSRHWPQSSAKLVERQTLGAALSSHLKHQIPGIIPINVKGPKELRALNCVPMWQSRNVYILKPDDGEYAWVHDYVAELLNFPHAPNDDQVDATSLALNQLRNSLFPGVTADAYAACDIPAIHGHIYTIGWIPARFDDEFTVVVFDNSAKEVVKFARMAAQPVEGQVSRIFVTSRTYNGAVVRVIDGSDEALVCEVELKGTYVQRIRFNKHKFDAAYENLSQLVRKGVVDLPNNPELMAELEAFHSEPTFDDSADYTGQIAQQSGVHALCLVTQDLRSTQAEFAPSVYYSFDPDQIEPWRWSYPSKNPPRSFLKRFKRQL